MICLVCSGPVTKLDSKIVGDNMSDGQHIVRLDRIVQCPRCGTLRIQNVRISTRDGGETDKRSLRTWEERKEK